MNKFVGPVLAIITAMMLIGCNDQGQVVQGRAIAYDQTSMQVTFIKDTGQGLGHVPEYNGLPPVVFKTPEDKNEMGAAPAVGLRLGVDTENQKITVFDKASSQLKEIPYTLIERKPVHDKNDPLVRGKTFPIIDREAKTLTIFIKRKMILETMSLAPEYFDLPDETWAAGDEIRIYYKEEGKSLRLMNITKTDIFKK